MRGRRDYILKLFILHLFILVAVSDLRANSSSVQIQTREGTLFVIEIESDQAKRANVVEKAIKIIEARLKGIGAKGEVARSTNKDNRIEVKVYGTQEIEKLRGLFRNQQLELKAVVSLPNPNPYKSFSTFAEAVNNTTGYQEVRSYKSRDDEDEHFVILEREAIVNGEDIKKAEAFSRTYFDRDYGVAFSLASKGALALSEWTGKHINNYIAVILNDRVISVTYIKSQITGEGEINGRFTKAEAEAIASSLQSGSLPGAWQIISEMKIRRP